MQKASSVTLEFGTGDAPLFSSQDSIRFDSDNLCIGVNIDSKQNEYLTDRVKDVHGFAVLAQIVDGAVERLPISDESVDVVFMGNVLGEPESEFIMEEFKEADGRYKGSSSIESKVRTIQEAARILKKAGRLVILENNTPYTDRAHRNEPYSGTVKLLETSGLEIVEAIDRKDDGWVEIAGQFAKLNGWWSDNSYLVIAKKVEQ
jgi:ubiquinone/menaquinone biosynthesis C-methylase UbiE